MTPPLSLGPEAAAQYEAVRPAGPCTAAPPVLGVQLLQQCGLAVWAHTCSGERSARRPGLVPGAPWERSGGALRLVPDPVRHQMVVLLAGMVLHHGKGGPHEPRDRHHSAAV